MTLKTADGKPFRLSGPNPIMRHQEDWKDPTVLHNLIYQFATTHRGRQRASKKIKQAVATETSIDEPTYAQPVSDIEFTLLYCLPATVHKHQDALYGEEKRLVRFGKKFSLEAVILNATDPVFSAWTEQELTLASILFVPRDRRWWRVSDVRPAERGYLIQALPSDLTPSFGSSAENH